jgi:hypothetical protein
MIIAMDRYTAYSPYMVGCCSYEKSSFVEIEGYADHLILNYLSFLRGGDFRMEEEDESFFDYMGHTNENAYPLDYWKLKLRSIWIRDNFGRLGLGKIDDGLYGLEEVDIFRTIDISLNDHTFIAGGAVDVHEDIDLFSTNKDKSLDLFRKMSKDSYGRTCTNSYSYSSNIRHRHRHNIMDTTNTTNWSKKDISLIRREYTCPSEIVHGFDIDPCQFILVKGRLYGTHLAIWSIRNKCQPPDMRWFSPTYIRRLAKYHSRGIRLVLPLIERRDILCDHAPALTTIDGMRGCSIDRVRSTIDEYGIDTHLVSILIYISFYDIVHTITIRCMTGQKGDEPYRYDDILSEGVDWFLPWIVENPMQQVSSNMYPRYLDPLLVLYSSCPILSNRVKVA